ncbi:MAG: hypothetical protein F4X65_07480 [Chloroflexi bacterium]|nr:hypothetical protein [Chloroflexota bacterium]
MEIEFDLGRALFLTYVGVGAAFLVLGSLVVFTGLIGWWGNWRFKRAEAREQEAAARASEEEQPDFAAAEEPSAGNPQLAAAIGAAVGLAMEAHNQDQAAEEQQRTEEPAAANGGWREQGRMAAFDSRRPRERER